MKGVIVKCLSNLVKEKFGEDKWERVLEMSGLPTNMTFVSTQDIDDSEVLKVVGNVCSVLNITLQQAADAFGDYWVNEFAPKIYSPYYVGVNSAKDFLLKMDRVHESSTKRIPNARPPRFEYEWENDNTLIMKYKSHRNLIDFLVGLIKGVGKYFNENLTVTKIDDKSVRIVFPK